MNSGKLGKRLFKELTRSPKKSAVLALISVVALWFWAPLVWGWLVPEGETPPIVESPESAPATIGEPKAVAVTSAAGGRKDELSWEELLKLYKGQSFRAPLEVGKSLSNPFAVPEVELVDEENVTQQTEDDVAETPVLRASPQQLGLSLHATIVSPQTRLATINGKPCQLGNVLVVRARDGVVEFTLTAVEKDRAVLMGNGRTFELKLRTETDSITLTKFEESSLRRAATGQETQRIMLGPSGE